MKKPQNLLVSMLASIALLAAVNAYADPRANFMSGEHMILGDEIAIRLSLTDEPHNNASFKMTNGATLSYGELVSLGDFYGVVEAPVSKGKTLEEREARFIKVFNLIDVEPSAREEALKITEVMHNEIKYVEAAVKKGVSAKEAYAQISSDSDRQFNCITGGGCSDDFWWTKMGRATDLAATNYDHFGDDAWLAYEAGHRAAMNEAAEGYRTHDAARLQRAYAMNALACHFLSDRYASGHIRAPRVEMAEHVTPSKIGNLLVKYMHDEESEGLNVHNAAGDRWRAYGDGNYLEANNAAHKKHIADAMQQSADEIFSVFQTGKIIENSKIINLIPVPEEAAGVCKQDIAPMFMWDKDRQTLMRRDDLNNPKACSWTSSWFGWSTLLKLAGIKGIPVKFQGVLAQSEYADEALNAGLITDKNVMAYMKKRK